MSLINDIRSAQVAAAEDAIIKNLESMGIVSPERQRELDIIALAHEMYAIGPNDTVEIDDIANLSEVRTNGCWVKAWVYSGLVLQVSVWVDFSETPLDKDEITEDRELVAAALKVEAEVKRLRDLGWKQQDFAQALKNLLEGKGE